MDPYILFAKTVMIFGIFISIYMRIQSSNGNVSDDVNIIRTSSEYILGQENMDDDVSTLH
jgi:hypothetical protein